MVIDDLFLHIQDNGVHLDNRKLHIDSDSLKRVTENITRFSEKISRVSQRRKIPKVVDSSTTCVSDETDVVPKKMNKAGEAKVNDWAGEGVERRGCENSEEIEEIEYADGNIFDVLHVESAMAESDQTQTLKNLYTISTR